MCEFNIQEIELFNYRQFEDKKFVLNSRMNVFAGKNSSGKTTVLEAVNVVLGAYLAAFKTYVPSRFVFNIKSTDARRKTQFSANIITRIKRDNYISLDIIENFVIHYRNRTMNSIAAYSNNILYLILSEEVL